MTKLIPNPSAKDAAGVAANIEALGKRLSDAVAAAVYQEANVIMVKTLRVTPKDTGNLLKSSFVDLPKRTRSGVSVRIGFDGKRAPYAIYVHEMTGASFQEPGTGAKFLENTVKAAQNTFARDVADRVAKMLGGNNAPRTGG